MRFAARLSVIVAAGLAAGLSGCLSQTLEPPRPAGLAADPVRLDVDVSRLRLAPLAARRIDPAAGLDPTDVAILAVLNSPDLTAKRAAAKVAAAQAFAAGLLPDPQIALSADFPLHPGAGVSTAYNVAPSLDLIGLITHSAALRAARASGRQADLELLWAEWSTAQQARQLAVTILAEASRADLLAQIARDAADRADLLKRAVERGDLSITLATPDFSQAQDATEQAAAARRAVEASNAELNALIGLAPGVRLRLVAAPRRLGPGESTTAALLTTLPSRRPDLLALQAGRNAQDANLRRAVLARFPLINLGFSHQSDNSAIISNGPTATLSVPIFNGGRGELAIQRATRASLEAEYQARLDQAAADVHAARLDRDAAAAAIARLEAQAPGVNEAADRARAAAARRDIDNATVLALDLAALRLQLSIVDRQLALDLATISLETALFIPSQDRPTA